MKYLLTKAYTESDWDTVDFALVQITDDLIKLIKVLSEEVQYLEAKHELYGVNIRLSDDRAEWFQDNDSKCFSEEIEAFIIQQQSEYTTVEIEDPGLIEQLLAHPEQQIRYGELKIYNSNIQYVAYGKHTSEEFWTASIPISYLIQQLIDEATATTGR